MYHLGRAHSAVFEEPPGYGGYVEGFSRWDVVSTLVGAVHTGMAVCRLEAGGYVAPHLHSFEKVILVLEGRIGLTLQDRGWELGPFDYCLIPVGTASACKVIGSRAARWLEWSSPPPRTRPQDTFFVPDRLLRHDFSIPDWLDPRTRGVGHFDESQLPPSQTLSSATTRANVHGISVRYLVDEPFGAQHIVLFVIELAPGGASTVHDHPFEEAYMVLSGQVEAELEEERHILTAGDAAWSGVGSAHGFFNTTDRPVRWVETQSPHPPAQDQFRFLADWSYLEDGRP